MNEVRGYKQAIYSFIVLKDRLPGDLNDSGKIGYGSGQRYNNKSFPPPYDGSNVDYSIPSSISAPFVDMYLEKIIDFQPKKSAGENSITDTYFAGGIPLSSAEPTLFLYYEYSPSKNNNYFSYRVLNDGTMSTTHIAKIFKSLDEKLDDGVYSSGNILSNCKGSSADGKNDYENAISTRRGCYLTFIKLDI